MKLITFRDHAVKALKKRLNISIPNGAQIDISKHFTLADRYMHNEKRIMCEAYCYNDLDNKIVLVVARDNEECMTIYIGGKLNHLNAPFVDLMYRRAFPDRYKVTTNRGVVKRSA